MRRAPRAAAFDVAIVGAGAAGLAAARVLSESGLHVVVLEARERAGGRMHTIDDSRAGAPIEYGPEFVHGSPRVTLDLLRESGDATVATGDMAFSRTTTGLESVSDDRFDDAERVLAGAVTLAEDCSVDAYLELRRSDGIDPRVLADTRASIAGFDAADPARASAKAIAQEWTGDASADGVQSRPMRGYAHLVAHMLGLLDPRRATVRFGAIVARVTDAAEGVVLDVMAAGRDERIAARAALVTVPLGVLQAASGSPGAVAFEPPLPSAHVRALASLAMGPVRKVVMQFRTAFWESLDGGRYRDGAFFSTGAAFPTIWTQVPVRARILTAWAGGPAADALVALDSEAAIATALETVVELFSTPLARAQFERGYEHDWQRDPFARGAYSYALVGVGDAREALARPIGDRLILAGEATARGAKGGTVAGALESGEHAARTLLERMRYGFARRY